MTATDTVSTPVAGAPEITLKKTAGTIQDANGDGKTNAGDTITYTFEVENIGTVTIDNVTVDDAKLGLSGAAVSPGTLAPGAKGTATATYTLTQADIDAGKVDNTATAKGKDPAGKDVSATDTVSTPVAGAPELTLKKTAGAIQDANGDGKTNAGDTITYTFEVENTGTVTIDNVTIDDAKVGLSGAAVSPGTLAPGGKGTATATYTLTQADVDAGKVDNTATARGKDPAGKEASAIDTVSTPVAGTPAIRLKKTAGAVQDANGDGKVNAGDTITYTFEVENTGTVTIDNVTVDDAKLGLTGAAVSPGTLAPGAKGTASATYTLTQADIDAGKVNNTASAKGKDPAGKDVSADASVSTPVAGTPAIDLKKTAGAVQDANGDGKVNAGDTITYTFEVENTGAVTLSNVTIDDAKLGLTGAAVSPGTLAPGAKGTASATYTLTQADIDAGKVDNTATAKGRDPAGKDVSADASVSTPVAGAPELTLKKTAGAIQDANGDGKTNAGDTITYTFEVENTGTVTLDNVTVDDAKLGLSGAAVSPGTLAPGAKGTASATYTLTQADIDAGKVDNTATTKGKDPAGKEVSATDTVSTPVAGAPAITLKKTAGAIQDANGDGKTNAGDTITYTFEVENTGTVTLSNLTLDDAKLGLSGAAVTPGTLAPGAKGTASATYTLTQADIDAGKVENTATTRGKTPSGGDVSDTDTVTAPVQAAPQLTLTKTAGAVQDTNGDGKVNAGDTITYTFSVENTGSVTLSNVAIDDARLGLSGAAVSPGTLAPGAKGTATATYTLTQADIDAGKVSNTATARGKDPAGKEVSDDDTVSTPVAGASGISLKKTAGAVQDANGDGKTNAGDTITYTFEVENTGAVTLSNVTVDDAKLGLSGAAVTPGTLAPGAKGTASATYTLTQADVDAGKVDNTASTKGKTPSGGDVTADDTVSTPVAGTPAITLKKTAGAIQDANGDGKVNAGDTITYTFEVENAGTVTLSNVTVDDAKLGLSGAAVSPGTLAPGARGTATATYTLTQADIDAGKVDNTATTRGKDPAGKEVSATDTVTTPVAGTPAVTLKKTAGAVQDANGDGKVNAGDTITYSFEVENTGTVTIDNATISDAKLGLNSIAVTPGTLAPGAKGTASATYTLTQADIDAGKVDNTATAKGRDPAGKDVSADASVSTPVAGTPAIDLKKTAGAVQDANGDGKVNAGDTITYTFEVENTGAVTLSNVTIDDAKLGLSGAAVTPGTLAPGAKGTASATYTLTQADIDAGKVDNTATSKGKDPAGKEVSAADTVSTPVAGAPAITLKKTAGAIEDANGDGKVNAGDTITYTFEVENTGTVTLSNVTVDDAKLGLTGAAVTPGTLAPGAKGTATATYTLTQADIDAGKVDNTASTKGKDPTGKEVSATDTVTTPVAGAPAITLKKTAGAIKDANGDGKTNAGDTITYTFEVENTGAVTLSNVTVDDAKLGLSGAAVTPGTLAPGAKGTASATYTLTQADIDAGKVDNTASTKGKDPSGGDITGDDSITTPIVRIAEFAFKKLSGGTVDANGNGRSDAGDTITYTFEVRNTGAVTLSDITISDPKLGLSNLAVLPFNVAPGAKGTATATYTMIQADIDAGKVDNTATAKGKDPTGKEVSDDDSVTTPVARAPALTLEKKAGAPSGSTVGSTIDYTFTLTNTGNVTLTNVTVQDMLPGIVISGGPIPELKPGAVDTTTFKARYTLTQADLDKGEVKNTASASGTPPGGGDPVTSPPSEVTTKLEAKPALTIEKKAGAPSGSTVGSTIDYTFTLTNTGNVTLTNVTVQDTLPGIVISGGPLAELKPGAVDGTTFKARYTLTQADLDKGEVKNAASAGGTPPGGGDPVTSPPSEVTTRLEAKPALTVEKKAGAPSGSTVGSTIYYTFTVTNIGNVTLTNVTVQDTLPGIVLSGGPISELEPGAVDSTTFKARYTLTQADLDKGEVKNAASAGGTPTGGGDPVTSPPSEVTTRLEAKPALTVEKRAGAPSGSTVGSTIYYTFTVTNIGNVTLTNVTVQDTLPGIVLSGGPISELEPGAVDSTTFKARYTLTQADLDKGEVKNAASAGGTPTGGGDPVTSPPSEVTTRLEAKPSVRIEKKAGAPSGITVGSTIDYTFTVTNTGNVTLTNVTIEDTLPGIVISGGPLAELKPGAVDTTTFKARYTLTQEDLDKGEVKNAATGSGTPPGGGDPVTSPPSEVTTRLEAKPALTVEKKAGAPSGSTVGSTIDYTFTVTNTGNVTLTNVTIEDTLPGVVISGGPLAELKPGAVDGTTFKARYTLTQEDLDKGEVKNAASAGGTPPGGGDPVTSPPSEVTTRLEAKPALTLEKKAGTPSGSTVGSTIDYTFTITNTGNVTLTNVTVEDTLPGIVISGGPLAELRPGAVDTTTFKARYTLTQADLDRGEVKNAASAAGTPPGGGDPVTSPPSEVTTRLEAKPALTLEKTAGKPSGSTVGSTIDYTFTVTNTGNVTIKDITLADTLPGIVISGGPIAELAPGQKDTITFTARYSLTQADIDAGRVDNSATVTGTPANGGNPVTSPPSQVSTPIEQAPRIELAKTAKVDDANANGFIEAGDAITYTFTVTNTGNVRVDDVLPIDAGPTFNGRPAGGRLGPFTPGATSIEPGDKVVFTATYTLTQEDVDNAAGVTNGVANTATARGYHRGNGASTVVDAPAARATIGLPAAAPSEVTITKQAGLRMIRRGEKAPFILKVTNKTNRNVAGLDVVDRMPSGFRYVDGSASIDGVPATPVVNGLNVLFQNIKLGPRAEVVIRLQMLALSSAGPGKHVNRAAVTGPAGNVLAEASAAIEIMIEPVFDCGDVIGKVFDDKNRNGYQDEGEPGLPGVRVATVRGLLITTDKFGRFHVACADLPDARIGTNFIMKLDTRTLPTGYRLTTENPRVIRLTAGKMSKLNFGAALGRVVRLDLKDEAFAPGSVQLKPQWSKAFDQLIEVLRKEQSILRISYLSSNQDLANKRADAVEDEIARRWRAIGNLYELKIESRIQSRNP